MPARTYEVGRKYATPAIEAHRILAAELFLNKKSLYLSFM
jgi:hypothetical protein